MANEPTGPLLAAAERGVPWLNVRRERDVNYAALLGVIAAASFLAPLVADLGLRLGLDDSAFAPVSLMVAAAIVVVWLAAGHDRST